MHAKCFMACSEKLYTNKGFVIVLIFTKKRNAVKQTKSGEKKANRVHLFHLIDPSHIFQKELVT